MIGKRKRESEFALADSILKEAREELTRADGKSALLLAAVGVAAGAVIAAVVAGDWSPLSISPCVQWLWWVGAAAGLGALVALAYSVYPRTKYRGQRQPSIIAYFGDVVLIPRGELEKALRLTAASPGAVTRDQLKAISHIVDRKYRGIQIALWLLAIFAACWLISTLVDAFI